MLCSNPVAVVVGQTNGIIDKMVLGVYTTGKEESKFLAKYKTALAGTRTKLSDDLYFLQLFIKYWLIMAAKK